MPFKPSAGLVRLLETPPVKVWETCHDLEQQSRPAMVLMETEITDLMQTLAWLHGYVKVRDQGHDRAVKSANRCLTQVRKALGFSYPASAAVNV